MGERRNFTSTAAEFGISCEACHGAAGDHITHQRNAAAGMALGILIVVGRLEGAHGFAHEREVFFRDGMIWTANEFVFREDHEEVMLKMVRFRTVGDMTCTAAVLSEAVSLDDVVGEIRESTISERGARIDDKRSEAAMETRKKVGYF